MLCGILMGTGGLVVITGLRRNAPQAAISIVDGSSGCATGRTGGTPAVDVASASGCFGSWLELGGGGMLRDILVGSGGRSDLATGPSSESLAGNPAAGAASENGRALPGNPITSVSSWSTMSMHILGFNWLGSSAFLGPARTPGTEGATAIGVCMFMSAGGDSEPLADWASEDVTGI